MIKKILLAIICIATVFTTQAQTINSTFRTKCDNLLATIESTLENAGPSSEIDFTTIISLVDIVVRDVHFATQWQQYVNEEAEARPGGPIACLGGVIGAYGACVSYCSQGYWTYISPNVQQWHYNCPITTCTANLTTGMAQCYGLYAKPSPSPGG